MSKCFQTLSLLACLAVSAASYCADALVPNHDVWLTHIERIDAAVERGDYKAAREASLPAFQQALFFSDKDRRLPKTSAVFQKLKNGISDSHSIDATLQWLASLSAEAQRHGYLARPISAAVVLERIKIMSIRGDREGAARLAGTLAAAAIEKDGPSSKYALAARVAQAQVAARQKNYARANELLEALALETARAYGVESTEHNTVVSAVNSLMIAQGDATDGIEAQRKAISALANKQDPASQQQAARMYSALGGELLSLWRWEEAKQAFAAAREPYDDGRVNSWIITILYYESLAALGMGDGGEAHTLARRAVALAEQIDEGKEWGLARGLLALANVYSAAGQNGRALPVLERMTALIDAEGISAVGDEFILEAADTLARAGLAEKALELMQPVLRRAAPGTSMYASATATIAAISVQLKPPRARPKMVEEAAEFFASNDVEKRPIYWLVQDVMASTLRVQGKHSRALALHEKVVEALGQYGYSPAYLDVLKNYEASLRARKKRGRAETVRDELSSRRAALASQIDEQQRFVSQEFNYAFELPSVEWSVMDPERSGSLAQLTLVHSAPSVFASLSGVELDRTLEELTESQVASFKEHLTDFALERREISKLGNIDGQVMHLRGTRKAGEFRYATWTGVHNGMTYQLRIWGEQDQLSQQQMDGYLAELVPRFSILDPNRSTASSKPPPVIDSPLFGYRADFRDTEWYVWENLSEAFSYADFGVLLESANAAVAVVPFPFTAELDRRAAGEVLLGLLKLQSKPELQQWSHGKLAGFSFESQQKMNNTPATILGRIIVGPKAAYLVIAFVDGARKDLQAQSRAAMDLIEVYPAPTLSEADTLTGEQRTAQATLRNNAGLWYQQRQSHQRAAVWFRSTLALFPDSPTVLANLSYSLVHAGQYVEAVQALDRPLSELKGNSLLFGYRAYAHSRLGDSDVALADYREAFASGSPAKDLLQDYIDLLVSNGRASEALAVLDSQQNNSKLGATELLLMRARIAVASDDKGAAMTALEGLRSAAIADPDLAKAVVLIYQKFADAAVLIEFGKSALAGGGASRDLYLLVAGAQFDQGDHEQARQTLEDALTFAPGDKTTLQSLDALQEFIGQGGNTAVRTPVASVDIPRKYKRSTREPPPGADDVGAYYHYWIYALDYRQGESLRKTSYLKAQALNRTGLDRLKNFTFEFDPGFERIFVNELIVRNGKGKIVNEGNVNEYYVTNSTEYEGATSSKILTVPLRGMKVDYTVELVISREHVSPPTKMQFSDYTLAHRLPVSTSALMLSGDVQAVRAAATNVELVTDKRKQRIWAAGPLTGFREEPLFTMNVAEIPRVRLADAAPSWESVGRDYLEQIQEFLNPAAELKNLATEIVSGAETKTEKARRIARYAQEQLRYKAIEFGRRAQIPNAATKVLDDSFGDCKDHSVLVHNLLAHVGVETSLALVSASHPIDVTLPALDQFDHMIVYCDSCEEPGVFLDTTNKDRLQGAGVPLGLAGRNTLVLNVEKPQIIQIGPYDESRQLIRVQRQIEVDEKGMFSVEENITMVGILGDQMRSVFRSMDRSSWLNGIQTTIFNSTVGATLQSLDVDGLEIGEQLSISMRYDINSAMSFAGERMVGRLPAIWERWILDVSPVENRITPFEVEYPLTLETNITVRFPSEVRLESGPYDPENEAGKFLRWNSSITQAPTQFQQRYSLSRPAGRFKPAAYEGFVSASQRALGKLESTITTVIER